MLSQLAKQKLLEHLYIEEGYRPFAYDDKTGKEVKAPVGQLTFGIGWNIQVNGCPRVIAEFAAMYFIDQADNALAAKIPFYNSLSEVVKAVLCDMAFNMGVEGVLGFKKFIEALRVNDRSTAALAMLNSLWAKEVGNRAVKLSKMVETDQWN